MFLVFGIGWVGEELGQRGLRGGQIGIIQDPNRSAHPRIVHAVFDTVGQ
jgi:hypothetical protein